MGLVKASSQDDVHPQAVLAAEALGAGILVAPVRIKDALQALGANESFRLQQTRISIGLMHGNTQRAIQSSTPLLQFFVFCTAFKLIYVDEAIGDIMFEMMSTTGLLAKHPISPPQLTRLLNQVSAHSDQCVPIDLMHQIASTVAEFSPGPNVYMHMEHQALAKLLTQVFEKMRDEEARSLCLTGHVSSVWIATALLWWFEDDAYLIVGGKLVCGKGDVRLLIVLLPHSSDPWKLEVWRKTEDALKFVFEDPQDEPRYINRLPLKDLINFFDAYQFQLSDADLDGDRRVLIKQTIAELAAALIQIVLENGKITLHRRYKGQEDDDCCAHTNLSTIADLSWSSKSNTLMSNYGWEVHLESKQIRARLSDSLQGKGRLLSSGLPSNAVKTILYDDCNKYIEEKMGDHHMIVDYIRDAAFCIAVDAILTCTTRSSMPDRYVKPLDFDSLGRNKDILVSLLSNGIEAKRFRTLALQQLLPGLPQVDPSSLVLSSNGIVAGLSIVWNGTCDPRDACAIKVMRGAIRHDNMNYTGIREADLLERRFEDSDKCPQLKFDDVGRLGEKFPILQTYPVRHSYRFETLVSVSGSFLKL